MPRTLLLAALVLSAVPASPAGELRTFDGKHPIGQIAVTVVYFVPLDRTPLPDWRDRVEYFCRRIERFHQREFDGQSQLTTAVHPEPLIAEKASAELRGGDADFIFFQTLGEVERRLGFGPRQDGVFPVLLVLSDINWRELDDFTRLRASDGQFEGQIIQGRHFPGAASGGARSLYQPDRGLAWGLVSGDGWRVPYSGTDAVVYHEGVGHPIGLPHPEPGDGSVMSLAQYQFWINQSWINDDQKRRLGWQPPEKPAPRDDLFSVFAAVPEPAVPPPGKETGLRLTWPAGAQVERLRVRVQTDLFGPWLDIAPPPAGAPPERVVLGSFDRPTPVSYRIDAALAGGQDVELWGYFQVRRAPEEPPRPAGPGAAADPPVAARWDETTDLLGLVDPARDWASGQWTLTQGRLESNKQYGARIELPYRLPAEYVMTAIVEPLDEPGGLLLGQRLGDRRFVVLVHYAREGQPPASALENVDGRNVDGNGTVFHGPLLARGRPSAIVCTVRKDQVTVVCDGRTIIDWRGDPARLSLSDYWKTPREDALFLGAYDCRYRFHRLTVAPISGEGQVVQ